MSVRLDEYTGDWYKEAVDQLVKKLDEYIKNESRWIEEALKNVGVVITSYKCLNPRKGNVTLPKELKQKWAVINLTGILEGDCFKFSVLATTYRDRFHPKKQDLARKHARFLDNINFANISTPTNTKQDIDKAEGKMKIERQNEKYVVSIFQWEKGDDKKKLSFTLLRTPNGKIASDKTIISQLLVKGDDTRQHYLPITNVDRLLNSKVRHRNHIWCERCLHFFYNSHKDAYKSHREICYKTETSGRDARKKIKSVFLFLKGGERPCS